MITKTINQRGELMGKYTPLIILAIFAVAFYIMGKGMSNVINMTKPAQEQSSSEPKTNP